MSKEYPCIYYENKMCKKFSDDAGTSYCVQGPCPYETPSNADHIRSMTDEELCGKLYDMQKAVARKIAEIMGFHSEELNFADEAPDILEYLKQPYKEGR